MRAPRPSLLLAPALPAALLVALLAVPDSLLRVPLALVALLWAPGHALLMVVHPLGARRLSPIERAAIAPALGLVLVPVMGIAISLAWSLSPVHVAAAYLALTSVLSLLAMVRASRGAPGEDAPLLALPSTRATFAIAGAALVVSSALVAVPLLRADPAPAAIGLVGPDGTVASLPQHATNGTPLAVRVELAAGGAARDGRLTASLDGRDVLMDERLAIVAGDVAERTLDLPGLDAGRHQLVVAWTLPEPRHASLWIEVSDG